MERRPFAGRVADELHAPVGGRDEGDPDLEVDRSREDETEVVVGVLADQVDATRRPDHPDPSGVGGRRRLALGEAESESLGRELRRVRDRAVCGRDHRAGAPEGITENPGCSSRTVTGTAWRWRALSSGNVSSMKSSVDVSTEARIFISRADRCGGYSSTARCQSMDPRGASWTTIMYGSSNPKSPL